MKIITKLVYSKHLRNEEANVFLSSAINLFNDFVAEDEDDRPVIESLAVKDDNLNKHLQGLKDAYSEFVSTLDVRIKLNETDELYILNAKRVRTYGDIKRIVTMQNKNNPSESSKILSDRLSVTKNLFKKTIIEVTGHIKNILKDLKTEDMATHCSNLKVDVLVQKLTEEQNQFEKLYTQRGLTIETRITDSRPSKVQAMEKYAELINYTNSMIIYKADTNYDNFIDNMNALINPINAIMRTRYSYKKDDDRPIITNKRVILRKNK